jgi:hypothetical protein
VPLRTSAPLRQDIPARGQDCCPHLHRRIAAWARLESPLEWPSDPPVTPKQDHAVLAWLALEADLPDAVHLHLLDALAA